MGNTVTIRGVEAVLRHGYYVAGRLGAWTVTREGQAWVLSTSIIHSDAFRLSQRPLAFVVAHANGVWRWPVEELQITGASLTAVLGPKER